VRSVGQQPLVRIVLEYMSVKRVVAIGRVVKPRGESSLDQRRNLGKIEARDPVVHRRVVLRPGFLNQRRSVPRTARRIEKEPTRGIVNLPFAWRRFEHFALVVKRLAGKFLRILENYRYVPPAA